MNALRIFLIVPALPCLALAQTLTTAPVITQTVVPPDSNSRRPAIPSGPITTVPVSVQPILLPTTPPTTVPISAPISTTAPTNTIAATSPTTGETSLSLDVAFGVRAVPPARVTVPSGETLRITAPRLGEDVQYIWTKNGRAIAGTSGNVFVIHHVVSTDAGTYACLFSTPTTMPGSSQSLVLGVGPTDRLLNLSTRAMINPSNPTLVSGFVVSGARDKKLIVRAIGPSLSLFGETNPLRQPVLRILDAKGAPYENGFAYPPVVGGPTFETDLADSLTRSGAFPTPAGSRDAVDMKPFPPGSYTVQVTSGDGSAGQVLLEIYEVP